jgi:hypothetical protein
VSTIFIRFLSQCNASLQIIGDWTFDIGAATSNSINCGYETPDSNVQHFTRYTYALERERSIAVRLAAPNVATLIDSGERGTWTMVYDEGLEVRVGGHTYFAFFAYSPKTAADLNSKEVERYDSHCDRTMIGWYHNDDFSTRGCYRAQKFGVEPWKPPQFDSSARNRLSANDVIDPTARSIGDRTESDDAADFDASAKSLSALLLETEAAAAMRVISDSDLVDSINADPSSLWKARLPTAEAKELIALSSRTQFKGMAHLQRAAQAARQHAKTSAVSAAHVKASAHAAAGSDAAEAASHRLSTTGRYVYGPDDELMQSQHRVPRSIDWRAVRHQNGSTVDYTTRVRSQGNCGSCYAFAVTAMAESRVRIASRGADQVTLSPQHMMACSATNQGCLGGFPFLVAKHAHEVGFVPDACLPYDPHNMDCEAACSTSDIYYSSPEYGYIGGYYGGASEAGMMRELVEHGPFAVGLFAPRALFFYTSGILQLGRVTPAEGRREAQWQETNHAVLIVGYGVDETVGRDPIKYWIVQNTWGSAWGDHGFFKIVRGVDECAIESMAVFFHLMPKVSRADLATGTAPARSIEAELRRRRADALRAFGGGISNAQVNAAAEANLEINAEIEEAQADADIDAEENEASEEEDA